LEGSFITRHNPNGSLDTSFGTNGVVNTTRVLNDFIILPDGKLMTIANESNFTLYRYNSDGTVDTGFGTNGVVITQVGNDNSSGGKIVLQPDGNFVVFGATFEFGSSGSLAAVRYHPDGSLDDSFGTNGILLTSVRVYIFYEIIHDDTIQEFFGDAAIQPDGKLIVGVSDYTISIIRLNPDGAFDGTFGANGIITTAIQGYEDSMSGIALQPDGKIVINGLSAFLGDIYFSAVLRFNLDGTPDNSFGTNGKVVREIAATNTKGLGSALAIQNNGKILTAGISDGVFAILRYNSNGTTDNSFGTNGILTIPVGNNSGNDTIFSLAWQTDGKLLAAGSVRNASSNYDLGLVRFSVATTPFDFDGDRRADLAVFRPSYQTWYLNRSQTGFSATQFGLSTDKLTPADFDGDGKTDIAVFRDGIWYWLNSSNNQFNAIQFGLAGDIPQPADFDGDGRAELAVYRGGTWWTFNLSNNQVSSMQFGNANDKPVVANYDGDGKADQAVYRNGEWHLNRSSQGYAVVTFGLSTDKPVIGDYDGDGRADEAVYRNGTWYVLQSTNGFTSFQWGLSSDIPAPADYDGDGKTDIAVYRDGVWYLLQSTNGISIQSFGLADDKPVPSAFLP
jgi:uncharacterized delta-60 repeat protein